jgi:hypothetical protein
MGAHLKKNKKKNKIYLKGGGGAERINVQIKKRKEEKRIK